jgi:hypothetical protein
MGKKNLNFFFVEQNQVVVQFWFFLGKRELGDHLNFLNA